MPTIANENSESVEYQVIIQATQAVRQIADLKKEASSVQDSIELITNAIENFALKTGMSAKAVQALFDQVQRQGQELREMLDNPKMQMAGIKDIISGSPLMEALSETPQINDLGAAQKKLINEELAERMRARKAVDKMISDGLIEEQKREEMIRKEIEKQRLAQQKKAEERRKNLDLANQELKAVEKEGTALQNQLKSFGQISRTSADAAKYLQSFIGTQQGQSILTKFFGNYQQAQGIAQQIGVVKSSIVELSKATGTTFAQSGRVFKEQFSNIPGLTQQTNRAVRELNEQFDKTSQSSGRAVRGIDAVRIALGAMVAMVLFQAINAIQQFFRGAIEQAKQFEATLYRLANAERQLSMEGVEVSLKGMKEGIEDLKKAFPIFSKEDIAELIGGIATTTKELGLSEKQMLKLGAAVAILNINSTEAETLLQTMGKVVNSLVAPQAKSIGALGLSFGKAKIEAKAFEMQLLQTGETFEDLTEKEKTQVKFQIVLDTAGIEGIEDLGKLRDFIKDAGGDFEALDAYLQSNAAKLDANQAAWKDLQTTVGQVILPFIPALTEFFKLIRDGFEMGKVAMIEMGVAALTLQTILNNFSRGDFTIDVDKLKKDIQDLRTELVNQFFKEMPEDAPQWFKEGWGDLIKEDTETATAGIQEFDEAIQEIDTSGLEKVRDVLEDTNNAIEDLSTELARKVEDLQKEYQRKAEDAERDYLRKIGDIHRDYENDRKELTDKHRREDLKDEKEHQNKLWELRQRFLMDLEEALHARDARQVLRLIKQYNIDKESLKRKKKLEDENREESQKAELESLKRQREEKLEQARIEYEEKLADLNLAKQREFEDLQEWSRRELEDLKESQERKLQEIMRGWAEEQKITAENAAQVYEILKGYFGPGGMTDQLYQYMMQSLISSTQGAIQAGMGMIGQVGSKPGTPPAPAPEGPSIPPGIPVPFAEGGMLLATRPTQAIFGENGPELVNFTPLSKIGKNIGKIFGDFSGGNNGVNGEIRVAVDLSPDLQGRIIKKSMDGVAEVIGKVNRSKV